ncbi:hypothetical protein ACFLX7_03875 [Chloroflexota bacterium]
METIDLEPRYSSSQIPGRCLKCLAEQQLDSCLRQLLVEQGENKELQEKYTALLAFLKSPVSKKLHDELEIYLAEGKKVRVKFSFEKDKAKYELKID